MSWLSWNATLASAACPPAPLPGRGFSPGCARRPAVTATWRPGSPGSRRPCSAAAHDSSPEPLTRARARRQSLGSTHVGVTGRGVLQRCAGEQRVPAAGEPPANFVCVDLGHCDLGRAVARPVTGVLVAGAVRVVALILVVDSCCLACYGLKVHRSSFRPCRWLGPGLQVGYLASGEPFDPGAGP